MTPEDQNDARDFAASPGSVSEAARSRARSAIAVVDHLSRRFGSTFALKEASLEIPRGSVFGLVGENGAGKTTLINHILGFLRPQSGTVRVFGRDPVLDPVSVLSRVGYLSEERDLPDWMTVGHLCRYLSAFYGSWDDGYARELCRSFDLPEAVQIRSLSLGQRARAGLVAALAHRPEFLVLDEPSSGLDAVVRRDIVAAVVQAAAEQGRTVLFSSHLLDEVESVASDLAMLAGGEIVLQGPLHSIRACHHCFKVTFGVPQEQIPAIPGALECTALGSLWRVIWHGGEEEGAEVINRCGGTIVSKHAPSVDDIFVAHVRQVQAER